MWWITDRAIHQIGIRWMDLKTFLDGKGLTVQEANLMCVGKY